MRKTEQLDYAHRNMLPKLQFAIMRPGVTTFESLERMATMVGRSYRAGQYYHAPPAPESLLHPDLLYHPLVQKPHPRSVCFTVANQQGNRSVRPLDDERTIPAPRDLTRAVFTRNKIREVGDPRYRRHHPEQQWRRDHRLSPDQEHQRGTRVRSTH